eukprot:COSAG06_NODE_7991_length_2309_cov_1.918552_1_plen_207_part_00
MPSPLTLRSARFIGPTDPCFFRPDSTAEIVLHRQVTHTATQPRLCPEPSDWREHQLRQERVGAEQRAEQLRQQAKVVSPPNSPPCDPMCAAGPGSSKPTAFSYSVAPVAWKHGRSAVESYDDSSPAGSADSDALAFLLHEDAVEMVGVVDDLLRDERAAAVVAPLVLTHDGGTTTISTDGRAGGALAPRSPGRGSVAECGFLVSRR